MVAKITLVTAPAWLRPKQPERSPAVETAAKFPSVFGTRSRRRRRCTETPCNLSRTKRRVINARAARSTEKFPGFVFPLFRRDCDSERARRAPPAIVSHVGHAYPFPVLHYSHVSFFLWRFFLFFSAEKKVADEALNRMEETRFFPCHLFHISLSFCIIYRFWSDGAAR